MKNTKKFAGILICVMLLLCSALFAVSCSKNDHTHTYSSTWTSDDSGHWHAATCEHETEKADFTAHTFGAYEVVKEASETEEGREERTCTVCGYKDGRAIGKLSHTHTYASEWTADESGHWHAATCEHETEKADFEAHNFDQEFATDAYLKEETSMEYIYYKSCVCGYKSSETFAVSKSAATLTNIQISGKVYDGNVVDPPTFSTNSTGEVTIEYKEKGANDDTYSIVAPQNVGQYVVRIPENGTVSLTTNKGSREDVTSAVLSATNGSEVTVSAVANPGYEFVAWRLNIPSDPAATCSTDATYTFDAMSEIHIFAVFTNEYTVTYNGNGGAGAEMQGSVVNVNNERNQTFTLGECTYTAPYGKEFKGWAVGSVDAFPLNEAGDTIEIHADTTIYAIWENTYIIKAQPEDTSGKIGVNVPVSITLDITQIPDDSNEYIVLKVKNGDNWEQVSAMTRSSWVDSFHSSTGSFNVTSNTTGTKTYRYEVYDGTEWKISDTFDVEFLPLVVTFVDNEHSTVTEPINVYEYNTLITEPVIPTFAGDTFYGWGWPNWDFANDRVTQDITLSAQCF